MKELSFEEVNKVGGAAFCEGLIVGMSGAVGAMIGSGIPGAGTVAGLDLGLTGGAALAAWACHD